MINNKLMTLVVAAFGVLSLFVSLPAQALNTATMPSTSAQFDIDLTVCKKTFDWDTFLDDLNAGITTTNPYEPQVCGAANTVRLNDVIANGFTRYNQGQVSTAEANAYFGNDPILGIWNNSGRPAQNLGTGSPAVTNRNVASALPNIFTADQMNTIYSTGGSRTAMPRIFSTAYQDANNDGVNDMDRYDNLQKFISRNSGNRVNWGTCATQTNGTWQFDNSKCTKEDVNLNQCITNNKFDRTLCEGVYVGGYCEANNGNIRMRRLRAGFNYDAPSGRDPQNPNTACARTVNGTRLPAVEDRNLQVYQFVYEFEYPTAEQCGRIPPAGVDFNSCLEFYQERYGRDLAGNNDFNAGTRTMSTFTYYGSFDDKYSRWVGWRNPDVDTDARENSTDPLIRGYRGFSVYEF
jgi:hypothetical protein